MLINGRPVSASLITGVDAVTGMPIAHEVTIYGMEYYSYGEKYMIADPSGDYYTVDDLNKFNTFNVLQPR